MTKWNWLIDWLDSLEFTPYREHFSHVTAALETLVQRTCIYKQSKNKRDNNSTAPVHERFALWHSRDLMSFCWLDLELYTVKDTT